MDTSPIEITEQEKIYYDRQARFYASQDRPGTRYGQMIPGSSDMLHTLLRSAKKGIQAREVAKELRFVGGMGQGSQFRYFRAVYGISAKDMPVCLPTLSDYTQPSEYNDVILLQKHQMAVTAGNSLRQMANRLEAKRTGKDKRTRPARYRKNISVGVQFPLVLIPRLDFPEKKKEYPASPIFLNYNNLPSFNLSDYRTYSLSSFFDVLRTTKVVKVTEFKKELETVEETLPRKPGRPSHEYWRSVGANGLPVAKVLKEVLKPFENFKEETVETDLGFASLIGFLHRCFCVCTGKDNTANITNYTLKDLYALDVDAKLISSVYAEQRAKSKSGLYFLAENTLTASDWENMFLSKPELFYDYMSRYSVMLHKMADVQSFRSEDSPVCVVAGESPKKYKVYCWQVFRNMYKHLCNFKPEHYCVLAALHPYHVDAGFLVNKTNARFFFTEAELRYLCTSIDCTPEEKSKPSTKRIFNKELMRIVTVTEPSKPITKRGYFDPSSLPDTLLLKSSTHWRREYLEYLRGKYLRDLTPINISSVDARYKLKATNAQKIYDDFCANRNWSNAWKNTFINWVGDLPNSFRAPEEIKHFGPVSLRRFATMSVDDQNSLGDGFEASMCRKR